MKNKKIATITVFSLSLVSLSGCGFKAAIETMALSAAMSLPYMINYVDIETQEFSSSDDNTPLPTSSSKRVDINFLKNIMAIPSSIDMEQYGVKVDFELSGDALLNFVTIEVDMDDLGEGIEMPEGLEGLSLSAYGLIPVGTADYEFKDEQYTDSLDSFITYLEEDVKMMDVVKITEQATVEIEFNITGKIGSSEKTKTYYFRINKTTLDDLASLAGTTLEELGIPAELVDIIEDWPEEPTEEVLDFVNENWPTDVPQSVIDNYDELPPEIQDFIGDPETLSETWPDPEDAETYIEENWPESFSDMDWAEIMGMIGTGDVPPESPGEEPTNGKTSSEL